MRSPAPRNALAILSGRRAPATPEKLRPELDLIQNHQAAQALQREQRIVEAMQIAGILQIEPRHRTFEARGEGHGERGLTDLPGAIKPTTGNCSMS